MNKKVEISEEDAAALRGLDANQQSLQNASQRFAQRLVEMEREAINNARSTWEKVAKKYDLNLMRFNYALHPRENKLVITSINDPFSEDPANV